MSATAQFTPLFSNATLARLERLRVNPRRRQTNLGRGEHLARKGGTSTEFTDYRDYSAGDDVRYVDWNIFSRLNRPYLKLYRHEEEMHVVILADASNSMIFRDKFEVAKKLAAAFSVVSVTGGERTSLFATRQRSEPPRFQGPLAGRGTLSRAFSFWEQCQPGGDTTIDAAIESILARHTGRGMIFLLSDFLTWGDLTRPMNRLFSAGLEPHAVQILAPEEYNPELTGDVRLVDSETGEALDISNANQLLSLYHEHRQALEDHLANLCRQRGGRFLTVRSDETIETILFDHMRRQGWLQ